MSPAENKKLRSIRVVAAVIEKDGRYLVTQRRPSAVLPLLWEFPGGKVEANEDDSDALAREVRHRLGVEVEVRGLMNYVSHSYEKYNVDLYLYECGITAGEPQSQKVHSFRWVTSAEFDGLEFTPADERSMSQLLEIN